MLLKHSSVSWIKSSVVSQLHMPTLTTFSLQVLPQPEQHLEDLRTVFTTLASHGIIINPNKCLLGVTHLDFLGHHIDPHGISPLLEKVQAVRDFPQPQSQRQLRRFIGLVNFYHRFLLHCANLMHPLHSLLSSAGKAKSQNLTWTDTAVASFNDTKGGSR